MTTHTERLITRLIERARTIAAAIASFDPLAAAEELLKAWQLETSLQRERRRWLAA